MNDKEGMKPAEFDALVEYYYQIEQRKTRKLRECIRASLIEKDYRVVINV